MIRLQQIGREYPSGERVVHALRGVNLEVEAGEHLAVLGPSGSGKSTLLHVIGCLDTPTRGRYLLDGQDVSSADLNRLAEVRNRRFGFVFQRFHLMPRATALENAAMPMRFAGIRASDRAERAAALLEKVGLAERLHHRPSELSGGEQQRVAIARALSNRPAVILADEPTGNLDSQSGSEIVELLEQLHAEGQTIIAATHDEAIAGRARRVIHMLDGGIVSDTRG